MVKPLVEDPELDRLIAAARQSEHAAVLELAARARLAELRGQLTNTDDGLAQLGVRIPRALRAAVGEAATLSGTTTQQWVTQALIEGVELVADPSRRIAASIADEIRARWRDGLDLETYLEAVREIDDPDLANV